MAEVVLEDGINALAITDEIGAVDVDVELAGDFDAGEFGTEGSEGGDELAGDQAFGKDALAA